MKMPILIDTSVLCSFANKEDVYNKKAIFLLNELATGKYGELLITDYIFDELITVLLRKSHVKAEYFGTVLLNSEIDVVRIDLTTFKGAWEVFKNTEKFSFTDCTIIAFMKAFNVKNLATFDKEFNKVEGINVVN